MSMRFMSDPSNDHRFMGAALVEAAAAGAAGDVPVGAVVVVGESIVGRGRNRREVANDPIAHAEVDALRHAAERLGRWRLSDATLYVTLEPCPMCAGALVNARIGRLVYGAMDPKAGAIDSLFDLARDARLNHRFEVTRGVRDAEGAALLKTFFRARRS
jgi:tRNA(adenine34) deaminase